MDISNLHFLNTELQEIEIVEKQWGTEHILFRAPHAAKIMKLKAGQQVSCHLHRDKTETFLLVSGGLIIELTTPEGLKEIISLNEPLSSVTINAMVPHTFYCPDDQTEDTVFVEASSMDDSNDNYRFSPSAPREVALRNR